METPCTARPATNAPNKLRAEVRSQLNWLPFLVIAERGGADDRWDRDENRWAARGTRGRLERIADRRAAKYSTPLDLTRTAAALRAFDEAVLAEEAVLDGPLEGKACVDALIAASRHVEACAVAVGEAFALDTADRNPLGTARSLRPNGWLRSLVARATSGACEVAS